MYYTIEPEVAGGIGTRTQMNVSEYPPVVSKLHLELDGWLGDDILETFPCFVVTERLRHAIEASEVSGYCFDDVEVTVSEQFREIYGEPNLPAFSWLKIVGGAGKDDFGLSSGHRLVLSKAALDLIRNAGRVDNCDVALFPSTA